MNTRKGIILAGGHGSRLRPLTSVTSKQLLPIYDKPMIYYPISVLMLADIRDILIISSPADIQNYKNLLGSGANFGLNFSYVLQNQPNGLAEAFILGEEFISNNLSALILGDNFFYGQNFSSSLLEASNKNCGATIFGYPVQDPTSYGVVEVDEKLNAISIEEKPINPRSNIAVTGLYFFDNEVIDIAKSLKPSERGELEITDVNKQYLKMNKLKVSMLGRGFTWLDSGTHDSLLEASHFVQTIEKNQGFKISCLEEIALSKKWIGTKENEKNIEFYGSNNYGQYLKNLIS
jgi:glucose-1-phosphate thymidylyltransferase